MKALKFFFVFLSLSVTHLIVGQKYFQIDDALVDEPTFNRGLAQIAQEYNPQIVTYKTFERFIAKDSVIENIAIVVMQEEEDNEVYRVFDFLEKPLPDFEFEDGKGRRVSKQGILGKYSLVGLYKDVSQVKGNHLKAMNKLVKSGNYNALALIAKQGNTTVVTKKAEFPVLNECISWYIKNISVPEDPKFLVLDENGNLKYIFQQFPDKKSTTLPLDPVNYQIYEMLK